MEEERQRVFGERWLFQELDEAERKKEESREEKLPYINMPLIRQPSS